MKKMMLLHNMGDVNKCQQDASVLRGIDVDSVNTQFEILKQGCNSLLLEFHALSSPASLTEVGVIENHLKSIAEKYNQQVVVRKKLTSILDLARSVLMAPENAVASELKKWRALVEKFQKEEKIRLRQQEQLIKQEDLCLIEEINLGVRNCQLALEGLVVEQRRLVVKNVEELLQAAIDKKSTDVFAEFITAGVRVKITNRLGLILDRMPVRVRDEVRNRMQRDYDYTPESFIFRLEDEVDNLLIGCYGHQDKWDTLFTLDIHRVPLKTHND